MTPSWVDHNWKMPREPETNRYPHLSLFVCFCLLVCTEECQSFYFLCFFLFCLSFFFGEERFHLFSSPLILWTLLSYTMRLKIDWLIFDRLFNDNQLKNLPSGILSSNTHLEWPCGCSRINTWTMKCPLKYALVQENLFAK